VCRTTDDFPASVAAAPIVPQTFRARVDDFLKLDRNWFDFVTVPDRTKHAGRCAAAQSAVPWAAMLLGLTIF
jgi:hypothetical protein